MSNKDPMREIRRRANLHAYNVKHLPETNCRSMFDDERLGSFVDGATFGLKFGYDLAVRELRDRNNPDEYGFKGMSGSEIADWLEKRKGEVLK